jgi:hypothetical protein
MTTIDVAAAAPFPDAARLEATEHVSPSPPPRSFAGLSIRELLVVAAFLVLMLWAAWATRELLELRERRIVSVSLSTIIKDFVVAESRNASSPEQAAARTKAYLAATDAAMQSLSNSGATVLVSEAVVGSSVPDMTAAVASAVQQAMAMQPGAAAAPAVAAMPAPPATVMTPEAAGAPNGG